MADPRHALQASFDPPRRHAKYGDALLQMHIQGFRTHTNTLLTIESPITALCGVNGSGKSTVLQLAASAFQGAHRYYVSTFILAGSLDSKPFLDNASVEFAYAAPPASDGSVPVRTLKLSRSGSSWAGYDRQPSRNVFYLGSGFYLPHAERDHYYKALFGDKTFVPRRQSLLETNAIEWISNILLCKYDAAHQNEMRKKYARQTHPLISARRQTGIQYSEANMGSGEARLYALVTRIESVPEKSLVLLEEPETALHPSAQFELGKYLIDAAQRRGLQFLMTTHSEYLLLALPQRSRIYLKQSASGIEPLPGIGVRQAVSMMDNLAIPAIHILVEDDVAEGIVTELLRKHDAEFLKTAKIVVGGDKNQINQMMDVFKEQRLPICAVRDGDCGADPKKGLFKLFGTDPPEKELFKSRAFREQFAKAHGVNWETVDIANKELDHHKWLDAVGQQTARKRPELIAMAARAYLDGVNEGERNALVTAIKGSVL